MQNLYSVLKTQIMRPFYVPFYVIMLCLGGFSACKKPTNEYTVKVEAIGENAKLFHVHIVYFNKKGEKTTDHNSLDEQSFEKKYTVLKGKTLSVVGEAKLPGESTDPHDHDHNHLHDRNSSSVGSNVSEMHQDHKDISIKITILKDGKEEKSESKDSETGTVSKKVEIQA